VLLEKLFQEPVVTVRSVEKLTGLSQPAAGGLVRAMQAAGVLVETTGQRRNRIFAFRDYLALFKDRDKRS
jgi:hypothetical protein